MTDFAQWNDEEFRLAQQMKNDFCDGSGKEKDPAKAAEIFHKIGITYRKRSPDKIALVQSVGLFNAAILRNPSNIAQIKSDLIEICQHILQIAEAKHQNVSLIKKAEEVKAQFENLRTEVKFSLKESLPNISVNHSDTNDVHELISHKISTIRSINKQIANRYKQIMANVSQFCENVMGKPPCEYAVVGMGSLARDEITPYSDFEHIILLYDDKNYKSYLEFFRWHSVIFHVIILNLQETIIPSLNIGYLNTNTNSLGKRYYDAITPRGISFDGLMPHACKFPLGRTQHTQKKTFTTELIKPVSEMLEYLSYEANLKNGYHLMEILTKTCFVFGNESIFKTFSNGVQTYLSNKSKTTILNDIQQQVKEDLNKFSIRSQLSKLKSNDKINIKTLVYRSTTIFISAMGTLNKIFATSSYDVNDELKQHRIISKKTAIKLQYANAIATEIRLKVYMEMKCQKDEAIDLNQKNGMENFLNIVGISSTINYFQIAYCLQFEIAKQLHFTNLHFYSDPKLLNITIALAFERSNFANLSKVKKISIRDKKMFDFDTCIAELETETHRNWSESGRETLTLNKLYSNAIQLQNIANTLYSAKKYDDGTEFFKHALKIYQITTPDSCKDENLADVLDGIGCGLFPTSYYNEALTFLNRALEIQQNITLNPDEDSSIAITLHDIGSCHLESRNYSDALTFLNRALEIQQNITLKPDEDRSIAITLHNIGFCYLELRNYSDALIFLNRALEIKQNGTINSDEDSNIAITLHNIGYCHAKSRNYSDALTFLNRALEIQQSITLNPDEDSSIADTLNNIGFCYLELRNYSDALTFLNRALEIQQNITLKPDEDRSIAITLHNIGYCHLESRNYSDALTFLNRALEIDQNITLNPDEDSSIAITLNNFGYCHAKSRNYCDALTFLNRALEIEQNITLNPDEDSSIAHTLHYIGSCHLKSRNYSDALAFLNRALEIRKNITLNPDEDSSIADTLHYIGYCHLESRNYSDALIFLNRALEIQQNITLNPDEDSNIAHTLHNIGFCHTESRNYSDALTFLNRALEILQNITLNSDKNSSIADKFQVIEAIMRMSATSSMR